MFLAWKEIVRNKGRFSLVVIMMVLISYLVYFLMGLAYGLASSYTNGITKWGADGIVLTKDANDNAMMSLVTDTSFGEISAETKARFGLLPVVAKESEDNKTNVYLLGQESGTFLWDSLPDITLGTYDVIADSSLVKAGYEVGSSVSIVGFDEPLVIKAFVEKATYQTVPLLYMDLDTWKEVRFGNTSTPLSSAVALKGSVSSVPDTLKSYTLNEYFNVLPGYGAQVATFTLMISFLIVIASFILGVFIYVLTLQKTSLFGVMKAQGISSGYLAGSVLSQTLMLTLSGSLLGFGLTALSVAFIGGKLPFAYNLWFNLAITGAFTIFSIIGALFSVRAVLKIDPVKAI